MSTRQAQPGERLSDQCGHHCGIRSSADEGKLTFIGHCGCAECNCELFWAAQMTDAPREAGLPMCQLWYERSGGVKPWQ